MHDQAKPCRQTEDKQNDFNVQDASGDAKTCKQIAYIYEAFVSGYVINVFLPLRYPYAIPLPDTLSDTLTLHWYKSFHTSRCQQQDHSPVPSRQPGGEAKEDTVH
eukprot:1155923-Pelagomonas_calceolata.AAC.2